MALLPLVLQNMKKILLASMYMELACYLFFGAWPLVKTPYPELH